MFFLWTDAGPIILSAGLEMLDFRGLPKNLGLGAARHGLRELRELEAVGYVERRLVPSTFFEIQDQSRVERLIAWDKERRAGLTAFTDVREPVRQEAEGAQALVDLQVEEDRRRLGFSLATRMEAGMTPLSTLGAVARALGGRLDVG